jgi:hypothetical protein
MRSSLGVRPKLLMILVNGRGWLLQSRLFSPFQSNVAPMMPDRHHTRIVAGFAGRE